MSTPVNLLNLREMTGDDKEMEKELFQVFIDSAETCLKDLAVSTTPQTAETWRKQAHALKGISLSLGAEKLGDLCKQAQESFEADSEEKIKLRNEIEKEYKKVRENLESLG